jgi:hypothetical protein
MLAIELDFLFNIYYLLIFIKYSLYIILPLRFLSCLVNLNSFAFGPDFFVRSEATKAEEQT